MTGDPDRPPDKPAEPAARAGPVQLPGDDVQAVLTQEFDATSLYALRAAVAAHAAQFGLPETRTGDIVLAVHELAANAIRHGAGYGQLFIRAYRGALYCQVADSGKPSAETASPGPGNQGADPDDIPWPSPPGHGLWVVRQIADHLKVQSGPAGTIATASFALPAPAHQRISPRLRDR